METILLSLFLLAAPQASGGGIDVLRAHAGAPNGLAGVADLDGDAVPDYLVGRSGSLLVYSGADGALLANLSGQNGFGHSPVDLGDLDGDGIHDFAAAAPTYSYGRVRAFSGADFQELYLWSEGYPVDEFGWDVAALGDVNGDGAPDVLIGAYRSDSDDGRVYAYSGADGLELFRMTGTENDAQMGSQVAGLGDVTGDGVPDFAVSLILSDAGATDSGRVQVFSGATRLAVATLDGDEYAAHFGDRLLAPGDLDGDGLTDLVVGTFLDDDPLYGTDAGLVQAFSSSDWSELWRVTGEGTQHYFGSDLGALDDWDGDGVVDLVVGAYGADFGATDTGAVYVLSGADGSVLVRFAGDPGEKWGSYVAGIGDVTSDPYPELLAYSTAATQVLGHSPFLFADAAGIPHDTGGVVGFDVDFPEATAGYDYQLLFSQAGPGSFTYFGLEIPLALDLVLLRTLYGDYDFMPFSAGMTGTLDGFGDAWASLAHPGGLPAAAAGRTVAVAAVAGPPGAPPEWSSAALVLTVL